ncbi:hypothetical protein Moror_11703 [Moniliophthora roreri MCA 2997]|uniref:F-box domain-containing protein n=1 Tax=Moniliophthora roreri (strain MCA 2997) TaxID=1381753 RepID=V2Y6R3_MONRO|nr:hypothetical protein Moror_11703 [Moniliophthora roreri MCA 2997]
MYLDPGRGERNDDPSALERHVNVSLYQIGQLNGKVDVEALAIAIDFTQPLFFHQHYISTLQTSFPNIVRLDLELDTEDFIPLFTFICSLTQLQVLGLSCESLRVDYDPESNRDLSLPTPLHTLYLNVIMFNYSESGNYDNDICDWLRGQTPVSNLRSLTILNCDRGASPEERVPTYIQLNNALTSLYLSVPVDYIDPLIGLDDEDDTDYEYDLSNLVSLESFSIHIPDSKRTALAPLPQLPAVLMRLTSILKSISSIHFRKFNLISDENNLFPTAEWNELDKTLSSTQFSFVQKEIFIHIVNRDARVIEAVMQRAKRLFPRCQEQQRLNFTHLDRYGDTGMNLLEPHPITGEGGCSY